MALHSFAQKSRPFTLGFFALLGIGLGIGLTVTGVFAPFGLTVLGLFGVGFLLFLACVGVGYLLNSLVGVVEDWLHDSDKKAESQGKTPTVGTGVSSLPTPVQPSPTLVQPSSATTSPYPPPLQPTASLSPHVSASKEDAERVRECIAKLSGPFSEENKGKELFADGIASDRRRNPYYLYRAVMDKNTFKSVQVDKTNNYKLVLSSDRNLIRSNAFFSTEAEKLKFENEYHNGANAEIKPECRIEYLDCMVGDGIKIEKTGIEKGSAHFWISKFIENIREKWGGEYMCTLVVAKKAIYKDLKEPYYYEYKVEIPPEGIQHILSEMDKKQIPKQSY